MKVWQKECHVDGWCILKNIEGYIWLKELFMNLKLLLLIDNRIRTNGAIFFVSFSFEN